eukprot:3516794-Pyramimonas_sp.AAC.1
MFHDRVALWRRAPRATTVAHRFSDCSTERVWRDSNSQCKLAPRCDFRIYHRPRARARSPRFARVLFERARCA